MLGEMTIDGQNTRFAYNDLRQRVQSSSGEQVRNYHYSPDGLLLFESDGAGRVIRRYLYSGNRLAAMVELGGKSAIEGKPGDALLNAAGALPGVPGSAATAAGEVLGACDTP